MRVYKSKRGIASLELLFCLIFGDAALIFLGLLVPGYLEKKLIGIAMISFSIWCLYYIFLDITIKYIFYDDKILIKALFGFKKIEINFDEINGLLVKEKSIRGFKLSGIGRKKFAFGRMVVDGIGTTRVFITSSDKVIYIHTENLSYGISPKDIENVLTILFDKKVPIQEFETKTNENRELFKNKDFLIPFIVSTIMIIIMVVTPLALYTLNAFPDKMPLNFDTSFVVVLWGTGKEFAFKQMAYGVCNMTILICMYYTAYFTAKYDRKIAGRYMYIPLVISLVFVLIQVQILINYL